MQQLGYNLQEHVIAQMMKSYDENNTGNIGFDEFIMLCTELKSMTEQFAKRDTEKIGVIKVSYEDFVQMIFAIRK